MASTASLGATASTSASEAQAFYTSFTSRIEEARTQIDASTAPHDLAAPKATLADLRARLTEQTALLPRYDQQKHEQSLRQTQQLLRDKTAVLVPRKSLASRRREKPGISDNLARGTPTLPPSSRKDASAAPAVKVSSTTPHATRLKRVEKRRRDRILASQIFKDTTACEGTGIELDDLEDCIIDLRQECAATVTQDGSDVEAAPSIPLLSAQMRSLRRSVIFLGHVAGSIFVDNCKDCTVVVSCRQFRMHNSTRMKILLATNSIATLEKCRDISFGACTAEQCQSLLGATDTSASSLRVQDFDHISQRVPSPHWRMLSLDERHNMLLSLKAAAANSDSGSSGDAIEQMMAAVTINQ